MPEKSAFCPLGRNACPDTYSITSRFPAGKVTKPFCPSVPAGSDTCTLA
jgi:hypothetical protein